MTPNSTASAVTPPPPAKAGSARRILYAAAALLLLAGCVALVRTHALSRFSVSRADLHSLSVPDLLLGVLAIYLGMILRSLRWALLMPAETRPAAATLIAPQFAGFAAVALFGRVADLTRPYLVARRTDTPVATQIAVYSVERALDLAATAVLFSLTLLFVPRSALHHEAFSRAGILATAATAFLIAFAITVRSSGQRLAAIVRVRLRSLAPKLADPVADRLLELQSGFATLRSTAQLSGAFAWSLLIWLGIALAYLFTTRSVTSTPQLATISFSAIMLLLATSMGASLLQLPIVGWFTQIAALAAVYHGLFGAPPGPASLCGILTFAVNTLSVIPPGLILARSSGLSLREGRGSTPASA